MAVICYFIICYSKVCWTKNKQIHFTSFDKHLILWNNWIHEISVSFKIWFIWYSIGSSFQIYFKNKNNFTSIFLYRLGIWIILNRSYLIWLSLVLVLWTVDLNLMWPTRNWSLFRRSGNVLYHRYIRWTDLCGNLANMNRYQIALVHLRRLQRPCAIKWDN